MRGTMKKLLMLAITPLPSRVKVFVYRRLLKFDVAVDASIGFSLIVCQRLVLESQAIIGHMSVIRGEMTLHMKAQSSIGQFNWITGGNADPDYFKTSDRHPGLVLGEHSSITSRHVLDCTDRIAIGRFTTIAGYRSIFLTHGIDYRASRQDCEPILIGDYCLIGSNVTVLKGVTIANRTILGAGSVLAKSIPSELGVWVGAPARRVGDLTGEEGYFRRDVGHIY
jgi:acetyltransferase-like isoleucine patch superfamily enzyme